MKIGVQPRLLLRLKTDVGPQVMAVRREMQPLRGRRQGAGEEGLVSHPFSYRPNRRRAKRSSSKPLKREPRGSV